MATNCRWRRWRSCWQGGAPTPRLATETTANGRADAARSMAKEAKIKGGPDQDLIRELASLLEETGLSEIEIEREGLRVRVARQQAFAVAAPAVQATTAAAPHPAAAAAKPAADDPSKHPGCVK